MERRKRETESVEINKGTVAVSSNNVTFFLNCVLIVLTFPAAWESIIPIYCGTNLKDLRMVKSRKRSATFVEEISHRTKIAAKFLYQFFNRLPSFFTAFFFLLLIDH